MIEMIAIICLIWNTAYLLSNRRDSYVSSGWENYTTKLVYSRGEGKDAWGQGMVLIVPKNQSSPTNTGDEG